MTTPVAPSNPLAYLKAIVGLIGAVATAIIAVGDAPAWIAYVVAVATAVGTYLTPNAPTIMPAPVQEPPA